jgi:hypothetical protein
MNPAAEGISLTDVWGPSADDLFATGQSGVVMRYDGTSWRTTHAGTSENLFGVWGASAGYVIAVGGNGTIRRFDGASWTDMNSGTAMSFQDVWGTAANDVFAVGQTRTILHHDGVSWTSMNPPAGSEALYSVWGSGPADVYCTGLGRDLFHYDGGSWTVMATPATFALIAVGGTSASDVFAVGGNGAAIHFDGTDWSVIDTGTPVFLETVWGAAANDVYAMGLAGAAYHWDGFAWSPVDLRSVKSIRRVFGVDGAVFAVGQGGTIHENTGGGWQPSKGCVTRDLTDVWAAADGSRAFAVGDFGTILQLESGAWTEMASGTLEHLRGVSGVSATDLIAVGENGAALHFDGAVWNDISTLPVHLNEVWMDGPARAFVVGEQGVVRRFDGADWVDIVIGSVADPLLGVWASSPDDVWVTGANSTALRWNGTQWKLVTIDPFSVHNFHDVHGTGPNDVYVASEYLYPAMVAVTGDAAGGQPGPLHAGGLIFRWDGVQWLPVYQDPIHDVLAVWRASLDRGFACGDAASILVGDTANTPGWTRIQDLANLPFLVSGVWGSSASDAFVVGDNGTVARYSR